MMDYNKYLQYKHSWNVEEFYDLNKVIEIHCESEEIDQIFDQTPIFCLQNVSGNDSNNPCNIKINVTDYTKDEDIKISAVKVVCTARRMEIFGSKLEYISTEKGLCVDDICDNLPYSVYMIQHSFKMPCSEMMLNLVSLLESNVIMIHKFVLKVEIQPKSLNPNSGSFASLLSQICNAQFSKGLQNQVVDKKGTNDLPNIIRSFKNSDNEFENKIRNNCQENVPNPDLRLDNNDSETKECNAFINSDLASSMSNISLKCQFCENDIPCCKYEEIFLPKLIKHMNDSETRILEEIKKSESRIMAKLESISS